MEHLKEITKQIWEELADAQKYIKCASKWKSDMYYDLSVEEVAMQSGFTAREQSMSTPTRTRTAPFP